MKTEKPRDDRDRDAIMGLLSEEEASRVSTAANAKKLEPGDEYVDLEHIDRGVRRAPGEATPLRHALLRKSVRESTWKLVLAHLALPRGRPTTA